MIAKRMRQQAIAHAKRVERQRQHEKRQVEHARLKLRKVELRNDELNEMLDEFDDR